MKRIIAAVFVISLCLAGPAYALYSVSYTGDWPATWPKELDALRKQARTLVGPEVENQHFAIPFAKRKDMEAAWPHILKVKSKGAPIVLVRGRNFFLGDDAKAGVVVHSPPVGQEKNPKTPPIPIASENTRMRYMYMTYIELVVDGEIVDLNRIALPPDTPIIDERFTEKDRK